MISPDITGCYLESGLKGAAVEVRRPIGSCGGKTQRKKTIWTGRDPTEKQSQWDFLAFLVHREGRWTSTLWPGRLWPLLRGGPEGLVGKGGHLWEGVGTCGRSPPDLTQARLPAGAASCSLAPTPGPTSPSWPWGCGPLPSGTPSTP